MTSRIEKYVIIGLLAFFVTAAAIPIQTNQEYVSRENRGLESFLRDLESNLKDLLSNIKSGVKDILHSVRIFLKQIPGFVDMVVKRAIKYAKKHPESCGSLVIIDNKRITGKDCPFVHAGTGIVIGK